MIGWVLATALRFGVKHLAVIILIGVIVFLATSAVRQSRRCRNCHEINREEADYCAQCGARLKDR